MSQVKTIKRDAEGKAYSKKIYQIEIDKIVQKVNARLNYDQQDLSELMVSMKSRGLLTPIGVRPIGESKYEIVFGNRRLCAGKKLDWKYIDAVMVETEGEEDKLIVNAIENMQRADVPLAEQGRIFADLIKKKLTANEIAVRVGVAKRKVQRALDLFYRMPEKYRDKVVEGTAGVKKKDGMIPARTAHHALSIASRHHLSSSDRKDLFEFATEDNVSGDHIRVVAGLLRSGVSLNKAIKKVATTRILTIQVAIDTEQVKELEKKFDKNIHLILYEKLAADTSLKITYVNRASDKKKEKKK